MPRKTRNNMAATFFHVLVQGVNKEFIFETPYEMKKYEKFLLQTKNDYQVTIVAYCLMGNHAHALIKAEKIEELSKYMHKVNTKFGIYYNSKHSRVGPVFRSRFKSEEITKKEYLYNCINYIHKNPVKAGICEREEEYPYSSFKDLKEKKEFFMLIPNSDKIFIDTIADVEQSIDELVENFLSLNKLKITELSNDIPKLKELLTILNVKNKISFRKIEKKLGIGREKLRKILDNS